MHYSKRVKLWVVERADQIELFYLPSSGAELNPEQRLSADLKHATDSKLPARTKTQLKAAATSTCDSALQNGTHANILGAYLRGTQ